MTGAVSVPGSPARVEAALDDVLIEAASRLALGAGAEGLRADLTLCRAAAASAALAGRDCATVDDLRRVAPLVLAHRSRRGPFDPPVTPPGDLDDMVDEVLGAPDRSSDADRNGDAPDAHGATGDVDDRS